MNKLITASVDSFRLIFPLTENILLHSVVLFLLSHRLIWVLGNQPRACVVSLMSQCWCFGIWRGVFNFVAVFSDLLLHFWLVIASHDYRPPEIKHQRSNSIKTYTSLKHFPLPTFGHVSNLFFIFQIIIIFSFLSGCSGNLESYLSYY